MRKLQAETLAFWNGAGSQTVTVLTTSLPTARYCALRAIRENIYKLNHIFRENIAHYWGRIAWISDLDHLQQTWK